MIHMSISKNNIAKIYLVLLTLSIYTPTFEVMDKMSIQNFLLSATNVITLISSMLVLYVKMTQVKNVEQDKQIMHIKETYI